MEDEIMNRFRCGMTCMQIASSLGMPFTYVKRQIVAAWAKDKDEGKALRKANSRSKGKKNPRKPHPRKLPDEIVEAIRESKGKESVPKTAVRYGVSNTTVRRIWMGETHKEVE